MMTTPVSFYHSFIENSGINREETYHRFQNFYRNDFKKLNIYSQLIPEARKLVELGNQLNLKIILATNPVFPEIATRERCKWANLDYDSFYHVTHAENSTSVKPNPQYYLSLLDIAKVDPENTLMIGNDYYYDMRAKSVGILTWLTDKYRDHEQYKDPDMIDFEGSLSYLLKILRKL